MKLYCNFSAFALASTIAVALLLPNHEVFASSDANDVIHFSEDEESPLVFLRGSELPADALPYASNSKDNSADEEEGSAVFLPQGNKLPEAAKLDVG